MKKRLWLVVILLLVCTLALSACNSSKGDGSSVEGTKQVPVYQGMTITNAGTSTLSLTSATYRPSGIMLLSANNGDNGNHNGHYKGDHADRSDTIDEENPYPDNATGENIEEEIKSSLHVVGSPDTIYYAEPNQDIYINIHIDNPDSFEIMSFTLNGKKYSSYMFEEGSDMETIVLKYNVGNAAGITEYTIDAIKYIDGTEIKDVIIDGNKTVMAGVKTQNQVSANISNLNIGTNSLAFDANIKDNNALIEFSKGVLKAVLYDGFSIVAEKDLAVGDNTVNFDGLKTNTLYQYAVVGYYDDLSGDGFGMNILCKDAFYTDSVVLFDNITIGQESIGFSFLWHEDHQNQAISALKLYKGDNFVKNVGVSATSVNELLSNTTYKLVAEYLNGSNTESICVEFTTFAKATPEISVVSPTKTQTSVGFEISETDADNVGAVTKIELVHANGTVVADSLDQRTFANLLSNNEYTVKVTYVYDLGDGEGEHAVTKELAITTDAKIAPSFTVKNENITTESINAGYDIADTDNILSYYKVELYKGNTLVLENTDKKINFAGLNYYTDYTVRFTYNYDLNNGDGVQTSVYDYTFKTLPFIDVIECSIANTAAVSEGDTIFMSVKLDNPLGMTIESVVVNGETYAVTGSSTKNRIFVEVVYNGQFAGGDTYLKVDKINAKIEETTVAVEPKTELSDNVFINGKLEVLSIEFVNENFEPRHWFFPSETVYVMVTLNNPTGYTVDALDSYTDIRKLDNNRWYFSVSFNGGELIALNLEDIRYHNEYLSKAVSIESDSLWYVALLSDEIKYIATPDDLKNISNYCYYELTNDIDLSGIEWQGKSFIGVLDGKGYSVKNMSFVGTVKNSDAYIGLFSSAQGVIQNLNIENATVIVDVISDSGASYNAMVGGLVAETDGCININNCSVDERSVFSAKNISGPIYVGGISGHIFSWGSVIENCTSKAYISAVMEDHSGNWLSYAGGMIGLTAGSSVHIVNCTNEGDISLRGAGDAGGIVGFHEGGNIFVETCVNTGNISSLGFTGGIVGKLYVINGVAFISDCFNSGEILENGIENSRGAGGLIGYANTTDGPLTIINSLNIGSLSSNDAIGGVASWIDGDRSTLSNNYSSIQHSTGDYSHSGDTCTVEQLNSKDFYTETLGWSEEIWDFSELDVENGKYPKLKA